MTTQRVHAHVAFRLLFPIHDIVMVDGAGIAIVACTSRFGLLLQVLMRVVYPVVVKVHGRDRQQESERRNTCNGVIVQKKAGECYC